MLKETIKYTDYNGVEREEDFYFNLTEAELAEMELGVEGGLTSMIDKIVKAQSLPELIKVFKDIIKNDEVREAFSQTEAYSILFMKLANDDIAAANFVKGILPKERASALEESSN